MNFRDRDSLEDYGRRNAEVEHDPMQDYYYCKVLGQYWVAIAAEDSGLMPHIYDGFWESWIMLWVDHNVPPNSRVADLGANVGFYTYQLAAMGCRVNAFEPNVNTYRQLIAAQNRNGYINDGFVSAKNYAVSDFNGTAKFVVPINHPMNATMHTSVYSPNGEYEVEVKVTDRIRNEEYDFIKIDIEGGEERVFNILDSTKHPLVLMEFRWDRYADPLKFAERIFDKYNVVAYVDTNGKENNFSRPEELAAKQHEDWMLVLRG